MVITANIPDTVNKKLEEMKKETGLSKSKLIGAALVAYVEASPAVRNQVRRWIGRANK